MLADSLKNTNWETDLFITDTITAFMYFTVNINCNWNTAQYYTIYKNTKYNNDLLQMN